MALQVWLPLNGNTNNQGLNPISMVGSPNSWGNGKMGKCATFSPTSVTPSTKIYNTTTSLNYVNEDFSWSIWINPSSTVYGTSFIFTVGRADAGGYGYGANIVSSDGSVYCRFGNQSYGVTISWNKWNHLVFTRQGTTIKIYKNGTLASTNTFSGTLPSYSDGNGLGLGCFHYSGSLYSFNGSINDFRIYNHCLSPKEVKEISKGLVLHYKMDDGHVEPTTNLAPYPTPGGAVNPGWDTSKHPNAISVSGWGNGYNGGVGSPEKGYHACWNVIDGIPTIVYRNLNSEIGAKGRWLGVASEINSNITAGATYTISFEAKSTNSGVIDGGIYYNNSGNWFHDGTFWVTTTSEWKKYSKTFTAKVAHTGALYIYGNNGNEGIKYVRNVQIELKDHATPYTPTSRSETTVYDCSGYNNHGTVNGNITASSDTTRYKESYYFNGSSCITGPGLYNIFNSLQYSTSWWFKSDNTTQWGTQIRVAGTEATNQQLHMGIYSSSQYGFSYYGNDKYAPLSNPTGTWHHVAASCNGNIVKVYIDGTLAGTFDQGTSLNIQSNAVLMIGKDYRRNSYAYTGKISDFRIYATPLSAEDVKELYNTSAMVCDNGTVMAYSLEE